MKIKKLKLKSYGKFNEKEIGFSKGLNIIYGANGTGKTTISTALKTFLYKDMKGGGKYKKTYIPIGEQKGAYDIVFEDDKGETYESLIIAGLTPGKTIIRTTNVSNNTEVSNGTDIGEHFFDTTEEFYDSVCYIKEPSDFRKVSENNISVNETLSASSVRERASADLSEAIELMEKELLSYARKTGSGLIFPLECELDKIKRELQNVSAQKEEETILRVEEEKIRKSILEKTEEKNKLIKKRDELEKYSERMKGFETEVAREDELLKRLKELSLEPPVLTEEETEILNRVPSGKVSDKKMPFGLMGAGVILSLAGVVKLPLLYIGVAVLLCSVAAFLYLKHSDKKILEEIEKTENKKREILKSVACETLEEYRRKMKEFSESEAEKKVIERELERIRTLAREKNIYGFMNKPQGDYRDVLKETEKISEEIADLRVALNTVSQKRENILSKISSFSHLEMRRDALEMEIESRKYEEEITSATRTAFLRTREVYKTSYIPGVSARAEEILKSIEKNICEKLILDEKFSPSIRETGELFVKDEEHLSSGISDSVYFAVRLAVCEFAFKDKERPILVLDDPFVRMDDERAETWMRFLSEKTNLQIIFFTSGKRNFNLGLENTTVVGL